MKKESISSNIKSENKKRCSWCNINSPLYIKYHDEEWGVPVHEDTLLFEILILETMHSGLSWLTILNKRENYRLALDNFNYHKIKKYNTKKLDLLMNNTGLIRHKLKINSIVINTKIFLEIQNEFKTFNNYIWNFTNFKIITNYYNSKDIIPKSSILSDNISKDLKKRGMKFIGSTTIYAYLQAIGILNEHDKDCFKNKNSTGR